MRFRELEVYQYAIRFVRLVLTVSGQVPPGLGDLRDQLRRAAISIPANIAEAVGRTTRADERRFFGIARGSAMECGALLDVVRVAGVEVAVSNEADEVLESVVRMLSRLSR